MTAIVHDYSWEERPYDQLQRLVGEYFTAAGFSVLRLSWGLERPGAPMLVPHFLVARDGVTALVAARPIGHARRKEEAPLARFCEGWAGHVFMVRNRSDCDYAVQRMAVMAALQNRVPAPVAAGTRTESSPSA